MFSYLEGQNSIEIKNVNFGDRYVVSTYKTPHRGQNI